jgi:hypothetical protein
MKKTLLMSACLVAAAAAARAQVSAEFSPRVPASIVLTQNQLKGSAVAAKIALADLRVEATALINWKVGDSQNLDIELGSMGKLGTMVKSATSEEGNAIWIKNAADLGGRSDVTEVLISRADAKILKMIHNGQAQTVPDDKLQVISQEQGSVTIPLGTFKCWHVKAKSKQSDKIELWTNPMTISLDGNIKVIVGTQYGDMTMTLTAFKKN